MCECVSRTSVCDTTGDFYLVIKHEKLLERKTKNFMYHTHTAATATAAGGTSPGNEFIPETANDDYRKARKREREGG